MSDHVLSTLTQEDGSTVTLPTTVLTAEDAALLGEYESWLSRERLRRTLFCVDCGRGDEVQVFVEPTQIGIVCAHRMLFYQGPVPVRLTDHPEHGESVIAPVRVTVPEVPIAPADVHMLRRYRTFLRTYALQEALWCLCCEDEGNAPGCKAFVRPDGIAVLCRCTHRVFAGLVV